jgi:hypothetical protein
MAQATIYLKTALFTFNADTRHVPIGVTVIVGNIEEQQGSALKVRTERLLDDRGRVLSETGALLLVPWGKVDHIAVDE